MAHPSELRRGSILELEQFVDSTQVSDWRLDASRGKGLSLGGYAPGARFEVVEPRLDRGAFQGRAMIKFLGSDPPIHFGVSDSDLRLFRVA